MRATKVQKRDGRIVDFDHTLICRAILKAMNECGYDSREMAHQMSLEIAESIENDCPTVDEIQVLVENKLMASDYPEVARAYIIYRNKRDKARHSTSDQIITDIIAAKKNDITRENANMNADTPAGMMMKIASERSKEYVMDYLLSPDVKKLVEDNILHIHDMDYYPTRSLTCLQSPIDRILNNGMVLGHGMARRANRIETATVLAAISLQATQNEQHGGQSIPAFDFYMAPFVRKAYIEELKKLEPMFGDLSSLYDAEIKDYEIEDITGMMNLQGIKQQAINMTVKRVHQAMESFIHNMNTIASRGGNQVVFSSINYGTDTSPEGRCIMRELLKSTYEGVGNGSTAIFPIQIFKKKRGVNYLPEDPNYDLFKLACEVTAKRFFPNFINLDAPFNKHNKWSASDPKRYLYETATINFQWL